MKLSVPDVNCVHVRPRRARLSPSAVPTSIALHGEIRTDDYAWLRDRTNPEVIAYLEAENAYTAAMMRHTEPLQEALFEEMLGRIKEDDTDVPVRRDGWLYYSRTETGQGVPDLLPPARYGGFARTGDLRPERGGGGARRSTSSAVSR